MCGVCLLNMVILFSIPTHTHKYVEVHFVQIVNVRRGTDINILLI